MIPPDTQPPERMQVNVAPREPEYVVPLQNLWFNGAEFALLRQSFCSSYSALIPLDYFKATFGKPKEVIWSYGEEEAFLWSFSGRNSVIYALVQPSTGTFWEFDKRRSVAWDVKELFQKVLRQLRTVPKL